MDYLEVKGNYDQRIFRSRRLEGLVFSWGSQGFKGYDKGFEGCRVATASRGLEEKRPLRIKVPGLATQARKASRKQGLPGWV